MVNIKLQWYGNSHHYFVYVQNDKLYNSSIFDGKVLMQVSKKGCGAFMMIAH